VVKLAVTAPSYARRPRFLETLRVVRSVRRIYIKNSGSLPSILHFEYWFSLKCAEGVG
jgi:hypothetical protein